MSSTSSSDRSPQTRSATEILASRYRHLFVLPSTYLLLLLGGAVSLLLSILSRGFGGVLSFFPAFAVFVFSAAAISSALHVSDKKSIATFRRTLAVIFGGETVWLAVAALGAVYSWYAKSSFPVTNAILFGSLVCAGLEFLIVNGAFAENAGLAFALCLIHPMSTLLIVRSSELAVHFDIIAVSSGLVALALIVAFPLLLRRSKTSLGYNSLTLFRAFMKTWTSQDPADLEGIISDHSQEVEVTSRVLRFRTKQGDTFLVLPGVHPGPFHPVGSYDLPGVVTRAFKELGHVMTLHRPGGHERNLATREATMQYGQHLKELAGSIVPDQAKAVMGGPLHARVGNATVSASSLSHDTIMTISFAPLGSDDLDVKVETELAMVASGLGLDLSIVDAHNSIDGSQESPDTDNPGWKQFLQAVADSKQSSFSSAYSHSSELGFRGEGDVTENGVGLLLIQSNGKAVLVLADANNAVPSLREAVKRATDAAGYDLIEFCTSDSHNLAARGLTVQRGYEALGEATSPEKIAELVVRLAKLAESRIAPAQYGSAQAKTKVRVFGEKALHEFAAITQSSYRFAGRYLKFALAVTLVLMLASITL